MNLENLVGAVGHSEDKVNEMDTTVRWGTGVLPVFSFSSMIHLIEKAACSSIQELLPPGTTTIATSINVKQLSTTPMGHHIQSEAIVTKIEGQKIYYKVVAYDEKGKIGEGTHERFAVYADLFIEKISKKNIT